MALGCARCGQKRYSSRLVLAGLAGFIPWVDPTAGAWWLCRQGFVRSGLPFWVRVGCRRVLVGPGVLGVAWVSGTGSGGHGQGLAPAAGAC